MYVLPFFCQVAESASVPFDKGYVYVYARES